MIVKVDISEVLAVEAEAQKLLKGLPAAMKNIVNHGVVFERLNHEYVNRSFDLQRSTRAVIVRSAMRLTRVDLDMGYNPSAPYASYIINRGLSEVTQAVTSVSAELRDYLEALPKRLST